MYQVHNILRLCRTRRVLQNKRFNHAPVANGIGIKKIDEKSLKNKDFSTLLQNYKDKITFSSYLEHEKLELGYFKYYLKTVKRAEQTQKKQLEGKKLPPLPVSLQYYVNKDRLLDEETEQQANEPEKVFQLPFAEPTQVKINQVESKVPQIEPSYKANDEFDRSNIDKWMTNYEYFDDTKCHQTDYERDGDNETSVFSERASHYGTPNPNSGVSRVPCGGCGALLHCIDPAIPGYLPSEIMKGRNDTELKTLECQRCHFLKEYNIALDVRVQPEEYEKLLQSIK